MLDLSLLLEYLALSLLLTFRALCPALQYDADSESLWQQQLLVRWPLRDWSLFIADFRAVFIHQARRHRLRKPILSHRGQFVELDAEEQVELSHRDPGLPDLQLGGWVPRPDLECESPRLTEEELYNDGWGVARSNAVLRCVCMRMTTLKFVITVV